MQKVIFDFVVVGSGIAGLNTALSLSKYGTVLIVTKSSMNASSTFFAQGGIAAVTKQDDSIKAHITDTLTAGSHHNKKDAVTFLAKSGKNAIRKLIDYGVSFDKGQDGDYISSYEAAHSYPRILHATDFTGQEIQKALVAHVLKNDKMTVWENTSAIDLILKKNVCYGLTVIKNDLIVSIFTRCVVLATGGTGQLYQWTTNPHIATGDGIAIAKRAGATVQDLEFVQFHPTALKEDAMPLFLLSEALRGEGAYLVNKKGERFMKGIHSDAELAPRDIVARAIFKEQQNGDVYLDFRHKSKAFLTKRFPKIFAVLATKGYDLSYDLLPVTPAAHFMCGGITTDLYGRTSLKNLFAYGEVAATGVHGANRLASNSLLEGIVFSSQIEKCIDELPSQAIIMHASEAYRQEIISSFTTSNNDHHIKQRMQHIMWQYVGIVRTAKGLRTAQAQLSDVQKMKGQTIESRNMLTVALEIIKAALARQTSLGTHMIVQEDYV